MNINRRGDVCSASSLFCVLSRSASGCARRSDGGGWNFRMAVLDRTTIHNVRKTNTYNYLHQYESIYKSMHDEDTTLKFAEIIDSPVFSWYNESEKLSFLRLICWEKLC